MNLDKNEMEFVTNVAMHMYICNQIFFYIYIQKLGFS